MGEYLSRTVIAVCVASSLLTSGACTRAITRPEGPPGDTAVGPSRVEPVSVTLPGDAAFGLPAETLSVLPSTEPAPAHDAPTVVPAYGTTSEGSPEVRAGVGARLQGEFCEFTGKLWIDAGNYYSWVTLRDMLIALGVSGGLANTAADQHFRDWYQQNVRTTGTDDVATFFRHFGEGQWVVPACAGIWIAGTLLGDSELGDTLGDYGSQTLRAYAIGTPPMLVFQYGLGPARPGDNDPNRSHWDFSNDSHGASGHAFMGAVPFLTAANLSDNLLLKGGFYFASTLTGWSRVNDDRHYLSQVILGWSMAYLACNAVHKTEFDSHAATITPVVTPEMVGVGVMLER